MSDSQNLVSDMQKEALETANTSGYRYTPYETPTERIERENKELRARIAELEAAAQWHPASEPPEKGGSYIVVRDGKIAWAYYDKMLFYAISETMGGKIDGKPYNGWAGNVTHWRDLPPMPEVKS
jgi:hypothetical protein